jgi:putative copper export protein
MTLYDWLLLGHILSAMVWVGGGLMLVFVARRARASTDPRAIVDFGQSLSYIGPRVLAPSVVGVLVFGVWMVLESAAWDFGQAWILVAIGLFVVAVLIGAVYLSRVALQMVGSRREDARVSRALLDRWLLGYAVVLVVLVLIVADMVFKPGV